MAISDFPMNSVSTSTWPVRDALKAAQAKVADYEREVARLQRARELYGDKEPSDRYQQVLVLSENERIVDVWEKDDTSIQPRWHAVRDRKGGIWSEMVDTLHEKCTLALSAETDRL